MLMTHQQSAELAQPGVGAFDDPTPPVAAQFAPIFVAPVPMVLPVRRDQLDAAFLQSFAQRIGIVGGVGNHPFRLLPRTALAPRNRNFGERGLRKCNFVRSGTCAGSAMATKTTALPSALHSHACFLAQPSRALVRTAYTAP